MSPQVDGTESGPVCRLAPHPGGRRLLVHTLHPASPLKVRTSIQTSLVYNTIDAGPEDGERDADISWHSELPAPGGQHHQPLRHLGPRRQRLRGEWGRDCGKRWCQHLSHQVGLVWDTDTGTKHHMVRDPVYDCQVNTGLPLLQSDFDILSLINFRFLLLHFIHMSTPWQ